MRSFLQRISSRKFLMAIAVQAGAVAAIFWPQHQSSIHGSAVRIAALAALVLAGLGYANIEAALDAANTPQAPAPDKSQQTPVNRE